MSLMSVSKWSFSKSFSVPCTRTEMPAAKFLKPSRPIKFDDAMRRLVRLPPPPSGEKAKKKIWKKKRR
jgi:hypothetical protein